MIVSRPFQSAMRGVGRNALDMPVAGLAALAAVFFAFAVPTDILSRMVSATGLPSLLSAAQPPLGLTARIAIAAAGALATFGLVFLLLRLLDRSGLDGGKAKPGPAAETDEQDEAPRLRRRDVHPDAPVRRPISATRDFGEPAPPVPPQPTTPIWLDEAGPAIQALEPVAPEPEPAPQLEAAPRSEAEMPTSIADLMERLEQGLARRRSRGAAPATPTAPQVFPEAPDDRLQSAIDSLQRLAARQP